MVLVEDGFESLSEVLSAKTSGTNNRYVFHLLVEQGLIYTCATLPEASMHQAFTCLFLVKQRFLEGSLSSRAWSAQEHELDRDFSSVIAAIIDNCNSGQTGDQISQLHRQVEDVRGIMAQNIERVVERGDRLDSLLEKTQDLEQAGTVFRATAKKVNRHMCLRNARMMIVIGIIVAEELCTGHVSEPEPEPGPGPLTLSKARPSPTAKGCEPAPGPAFRRRDQL
ncbi:hypothetical protein HPB50_022809 [Hyalomma asiaticum]|uniref:Uncharacterized protein n=1 Tax=Hyalomma asiaticum TaxID=266040 RepID=A0ACB7TT53_HYAAI|nr:hypothetical protein HPB50_022809 [Hyalomma asiaticum]